MFNNCDPITNGEHAFYLSIKDKIKVIFDVGCRADSEFIDFNGEVHYFDPVHAFIEKLKGQSNNNSVSYFNSFGLGSENTELFYYPRYQSFHDRVKSCHISDASNRMVLTIKKAKDYILEKNVEHIDFLKIDTEGYELNVLKGFEDLLDRVSIIQFEYGGTFLDNNTKLIDVKTFLENKGFSKFSYLTGSGSTLITDFNDHYQYCNIVCYNTSKSYN